MTANKLLDYPEIGALNGTAQKLIVLLHGVGSDGYDLIGLVPFIQKSLPDYHFISPHGVENYDMAPFGYQWFSLLDRSPEKISNLAEKNALLLQNIIKDKQDKLSLTNAETVILGFSQGTMIGIYLTLIQEIPYSATVGFSGKLIPPSTIKNTLTPICLIHGEDDDVVPCEESDKMAQVFTKNNILNEKLIISHLGHSIDTKGIEFAVNFIQNKLRII